MAVLVVAAERQMEQVVRASQDKVIVAAAAVETTEMVVVEVELAILPPSIVMVSVRMPVQVAAAAPGARHQSPALPMNTHKAALEAQDPMATVGVQQITSMEPKIQAVAVADVAVIPALAVVAARASSSSAMAVAMVSANCTNASAATLRSCMVEVWTVNFLVDRRRNLWR